MEERNRKQNELTKLPNTQSTADGSDLFDDSILEPGFEPSVNQTRGKEGFSKNQGNVRRICTFFGLQFLLGPGFEPITPIILITIITVVFIGISLLVTCLPSYLVEIPFSICFVLLVGGMSNSAFMDPGHISRRRIDLDDEDQAQIYCRTCNVTREEEQSFNISHCSECDICVKEFDHHCGVMGNCIGQKNIWGFRLMLVMFILSAIAAYGVLFYTMISCYGGHDSHKSKSSSRVPLIGESSSKIN